MDIGKRHLKMVQLLTPGKHQSIVIVTWTPTIGPTVIHPTVFNIIITRLDGRGTLGGLEDLNFLLFLDPFINNFQNDFIKNLQTGSTIRLNDISPLLPIGMRIWLDGIA